MWLIGPAWMWISDTERAESREDADVFYTPTLPWLAGSGGMRIPKTWLFGEQRTLSRTGVEIWE